MAATSPLLPTAAAAAAAAVARASGALVARHAARQPAAVAAARCDAAGAPSSLSAPAPPGARSRAAARSASSSSSAPAAGRPGGPGAAERVLVTGARGQIGVELVPMLRQFYGRENVIATDLEACEFAGVRALDVLDRELMEGTVRRHGVTMIVHLASLLSAVGEMKPQLALKINNGGLENVLEIARAAGGGGGRPMRVFSPSSIAAFGASTPRDGTPDETAHAAQHHVRRHEGIRRAPRGVLRRQVRRRLPEHPVPRDRVRGRAARRRHHRLRRGHLPPGTSRAGGTSASCASARTCR